MNKKIKKVEKRPVSVYLAVETYQKLTALAKLEKSSCSKIIEGLITGSIYRRRRLNLKRGIIS